MNAEFEISGVTLKTKTDLARDSSKLSDVVGLENLKDKVAAIKKAIVEKSKDIALPKGLLFAGLPGCGKTFFGKIFAKEIGYNFMYVPSSELVSGFQGAGKNKMKKIFKWARSLGNCVIFFDEVDAVGKDRNQFEEQGSVLQQFLTEMDGQENNNGLIIIAATNVLDQLDKAFIRSGRFDAIFNFDAPNLKQRTEAFKTYNLPGRIDYRVIAEITEGRSFADIVAIVKLAKEKAFVKNEIIANKHMINAVQTISVGETSNAGVVDEKSYKYLVSYVAGRTLGFVYKLPLFVFAQSKVGHKLSQAPTIQKKVVYDIEDVVVQLLSIYIAKEVSFKTTGASTTLYSQHDVHESERLMREALLMLGVIDSNRIMFERVKLAMHVSLTEFAREIIEKYAECLAGISQILGSNSCITRDELRAVMKSRMPGVSKIDLFNEFKKIIEALLRHVYSEFSYKSVGDADEGDKEEALVSV